MTDISNCSIVFSPLQIAAHLLGCRPDEILSLRSSSAGAISVIAPSGQKYQFSRFQVNNANLQLVEETVRSNSAVAANENQAANVSDKKEGKPSSRSARAHSKSKGR
jgi:hypothetical protein